MPQKIYFGDIRIRNLKTGERITLTGRIFKERDQPNDPYFRDQTLKKFKGSEREKYVIEKLCFDGAKYLGDTNY